MERIEVSFLFHIVMIVESFKCSTKIFLKRGEYLQYTDGLFPTPILFHLVLGGAWTLVNFKSSPGDSIKYTIQYFLVFLQS